MSDYVTMRNRIALELRQIATAAASDIPTQIANAVLDAIKHHERQRFYFNAKTATFATVAAQENYAAAAHAEIPNIVTIDAMNVSIDGSKCKISPLDYGVIDDMQDGSVTSDPEYFAYYAQQIRLYPIPSAVRTVTMSYVYRLTTLSGDTDTNAWMTDGEALIRSRAKYLLAMETLHDTDLATRCAAIGAEAYSELRGETNRRRSNGILRTELGGARPYNIVSDR